ncbi:hypothetical protein MJ584_03025 [Klebsiella pneumoniae]|nr:hypothetical protein MJ584_03025 [Klebsiella pneumoniae]
MGIELVVPPPRAKTRKSPAATINSIPLRIIMFLRLRDCDYVGDAVGSVVPSKSPFVELFVLVGLPATAGLINFVVLTSAASSANSDVFSTSIMLFGLAQDGQAPKMFAKLSACSCRRGLNLLLHVSAGRGGADGQPERDCRLHHDHHGVGDPVYVRLDHHPLLLRRIAKPPSAA